jgi:hypothetical protein
MTERCFCIACSARAQTSRVLPDGRHFVTCPNGIRCSSTAHHPVRDALVSVCDAVLGPSRVIAERPRDHRALNDFMATTGAGLLHRPDLVLVGLDGPRSHTIVNVKTFDSASDTTIAIRHTDTTRLAHHRHLEDDTPRAYFGPSGAPPDHLRRMRVVTFAVSTFAALGPQAQALIARLGALCGRTIPSSLLAETTWAAPLFAPFARQAITLAMRRSLAASLRDCTCSEEVSHRLHTWARARAQRAVARAQRARGSASSPIQAVPLDIADAIGFPADAPIDPALPAFPPGPGMGLPVV